MTATPSPSSGAPQDLPRLPGAAFPGSLTPRSIMCNLFTADQMRDYAREAILADRAARQEAVLASKPWLFIQMGDDGDAYPTWCADEAEIRAAVAAAVYCEPNSLDADETEQVLGITASLIEDGFFDFEGDPGLKLFRITDGVATPAQQAAAVESELTMSDAYTLLGHAEVIGGTDMPDYMRGLAARIARSIGDAEGAKRCEDLRAARTAQAAGKEGAA